LKDNLQSWHLPLIRPLADIVHFKYARTYLLCTWHKNVYVLLSAEKKANMHEWKSFAIVRVEVRCSSCIWVKLGNSSKILRVSIPWKFRENVFRSN